MLYNYFHYPAFAEDYAYEVDEYEKKLTRWDVTKWACPLSCFPSVNSTKVLDVKSIQDLPRRFQV